MKRTHHPDIPFSSLPAIAQCACYQPRQSVAGEDSDASAGEKLHEVCYHLVQGKPLPPKLTEEVDQADIEDCEAVVTEVLALLRDNVPGAECAYEEQVELFDDAGDRVSYGHCDVHGANAEVVAVVDWKSGFDFRIENHYYRPQLLGYALCDMRRLGLTRALCCEAYIKPRKLRHYWVTYQEASGIVGATIAKRRDQARRPQPCDACGLCGAILECPAVNERMAVAQALFRVDCADLALALRDPAAAAPLVLARLLTFVREDGKDYLKAVQRLFDGIETAALERSKTEDLPGYKRVVKLAAKELPPEAYEQAVTLSGLSPQQFMRGLTASLPKLAKEYAAATALSQKKARAELEGRLDALLRRKAEPDTVLERLADGDIADAVARSRAA